MKKEEVVKNNRDFDSIILKGNNIKNEAFVMYFLSNDLNIRRFGISVGKKIGNAVKRNYYKRVIRNICDLNKKNYPNGQDYIIIMRKGCQELSFKEMNDRMVNLLKKIQN